MVEWTPPPQERPACNNLSDADAGRADQATCWVQEALIKGWYEFKEGDDIYPHFIWRIVGDKKAWKGRCINTTLGTYKGWPLQDDEHDEV